jgi:hypothetical protein
VDVNARDKQLQGEKILFPGHAGLLYSLTHVESWHLLKSI